MATYVVMDGGRGGASADTQLVRDGFSIIAFIAPVIWLLWHRLWIEAALALAASVAMAALGTIAGFENAAPLLSALVSVYVAVEGPQDRKAGSAQRQ